MALFHVKLLNSAYHLNQFVFYQTQGIANLDANLINLANQEMGKVGVSIQEAADFNTQ
jgi:hypothetical protein